MFELPVPPGTNNLFYNKKGGGGRRKAKRYMEWINAAGWELQAQRPDRFPGEVHVVLFFPENKQRDIDGYIKPILDLLVTHRVIENDRFKYVKALDVRWHTGDKVHVHVRRFMSNSVPVAA